MIQTNENGRTMLEMLGVLSIIGIISISGLNIIAKTQHEQKVTTLISDISQVANQARKLSCQYDDGYGDGSAEGNYSVFLYYSKAYPRDWTYTKSGSAGYFTGVMDTKYVFTGNDEKFTMDISSLDEEICMKLATFNWGSAQSSGLLEISINGNTAISTSGTDYPLGLDKASDGNTGCNKEKGNYVKFVYKGCKY